MVRMKRELKLIALFVFCSVFLPVAARAQGKVEGSISNGTTSKVVPHQEVRLLMPRNGMQPIATATSDASGHFAFTTADIDPKSFYLASTEFQGASYNAAVAFDPSAA